MSGGRGECMQLIQQVGHLRLLYDDLKHGLDLMYKQQQESVEHGYEDREKRVWLEW